jgi:tRNA-dihydrouridine synthase
MNNNIITNFPLIFAPMEGITDHLFRNMILKYYPDWDFLFTDFLRLSTNQNFRDSHVLKFYGQDRLDYQSTYCQKVILQILSTQASTTPHNIKQIAGLGFRWIDLNIGCPSKQVNSHGGGSYLLSDLKALRYVIETIRKHFDGFFSVKIRLGYKTNHNFFKAIDIFEQLGVNLITIHGRNQHELYRGQANWELIHQAHKKSRLPILGNGDIRHIDDLIKIKKQNLASGVMVARGAIRRPWLAKQFRQNLNFSINQEDELRLIFMNHLLETYDHLDQETQLKKLKKLTHYLFDDDEKELKTHLLRSRTLREFVQTIKL